MFIFFVFMLAIGNNLLWGAASSEKGNKEPFMITIEMKAPGMFTVTEEAHIKTKITPTAIHIKHVVIYKNDYKAIYNETVTTLTTNPDNTEEYAVTASKKNRHGTTPVTEEITPSSRIVQYLLQTARHAPAEKGVYNVYNKLIFHASMPESVWAIREAHTKTSKVKHHETLSIQRLSAKNYQVSLAGCLQPTDAHQKNIDHFIKQAMPQFVIKHLKPEYMHPDPAARQDLNKQMQAFIIGRMIERMRPDFSVKKN